jgi:membrane protein YdbS with pleckstrin-like domain
MSWRALVLRVFRVPPEPEPPPGSPPRVFRAARNYLTLRIVQWVIVQVALLPLPVMLTLIAVYARPPRPMAIVFGVLQVIAWGVFLVQFLLGWATLRLNYELRWYMVSDRAIRIREGVATVREKTMALANVQNIAVHQGPLQRMLRIADVEVKTAGGGSGGAGLHGKKGVGEPMHVAFFRGVDNAEEIRNLVREGVRRQKGSGLGDPDEQQHAAPDAVAELVAEARRLRAVVEAAAVRSARKTEDA